VQVLHQREEIESNRLFSQLSLDVLALTTQFALSGGTTNPFVTLYLIHVAMAAVMMPGPLAVAITGLVLGCYALLHFVYLPMDFSLHSLGADTLLTGGRALAFVITSVSVSGFVLGLSSTLRRREAQLLEARDRTSRTDRLRAVGTLAAGAAHELNTPLSTLGLRLRRIVRRHADPDTLADTEAMENQLDRCSQIVEQLLVGAGDPSSSDIGRYPLGPLVETASGWWSKGNGVQIELSDGTEGAEVEVPRVAFIQGLVNLLENAREAQDEAGVGRPIELRVDREGASLRVRVRDHGVGLPEADRVGDPFYTTKATGTGLGVFVARAVADGVGGGLRYDTGEGRYTEAVWWFPEVERRSA
jgi:two-component system sensor histidine kinase RegB